LIDFPTASFRSGEFQELLFWYVVPAKISMSLLREQYVENGLPHHKQFAMTEKMMYAIPTQAGISSIFRIATQRLQ
jgi:hypothetical protein